MNRGELEQFDAEPLQLFSHRWTSIDNVEVRPYDFTRPEWVGKDQMRTLKNLHKGFSQNFEALLSEFLQTTIEVKVANIEQMTFSEFTHSLPNPTYFNLLTCEPLEGHICLEISPQIIYPVIGRLLGGSNPELFIPPRPLTAIETRLAGKIIDRATKSIRKAWLDVIDIHYTLSRSESNAQLVQTLPPNEAVVVASFEIKMANRAGTMNLCIPCNVIHPVIDKVASHAPSAYKPRLQNDQLRQRVARRLGRSQLTATTVLADTTIKLKELMNLQVGDVILTNKATNKALALLIGGKQKFLGHLGQLKGSRVFKIQQLYTNKEV